MEAILDLVPPTPPSRSLEMGCGGGELLSRLSRKTRLAVGMDLSSAGLRLARSRVNAAGSGHPEGAVLCARAESLPFADGSFSTMVAQHLIEHLPDPAEALREWRRVLQPGGVLALVTPNATFPDPSLFEDPEHVHLFTPETLRLALETVGFRVTRLYTLFPYLGRGRLARSASIRLASMTRYLPRKFGCGRSLVAAATPF